MTLGRTRTRRTPSGVGGRTASNPIRLRRRSPRGSPPSEPAVHGQQVWNLRPSDAVLVDSADTGLGHKQVQRRNLSEGWVISRRPAHAALVSEADFVNPQDIAASRGLAGPAARPYLLTGSLHAVGADAGWNQPVPRQARPSVPSRPHQRHRPRSHQAEGHLPARGRDTALPGSPCHPQRRQRDAGPRARSASRPKPGSRTSSTSCAPTAVTGYPSSPAGTADSRIRERRPAKRRRRKSTPLRPEAEGG